MEIHAPGKLPLTAREFVAHIAVVTTGILIALSLEGLVEWNHHRKLVREARENLAHEIADNKTAVDGSLKDLDGQQKRLSNALQFADDLLKTGKTSIHEVQLAYSAPTITSAAWETAQATGALGHMSYGEVKKFAEVYQLQRLYTSSQHEHIGRLTQAIATFMGGDPTKAKPKDLEIFRERVLNLIADGRTETDLAKGLLRAYTGALEPGRAP